MIVRFLAVAASALVLASPATAACAHPRTSLGYLQGQVMCPTCHTTLDMSDSQAAQQIKGFIAKKVAACWTAKQIESALVAHYGQQILAAPSHRGFDLSRRCEKTRAASVRSWSSPAGAGSAVWRTW